MNSKVNNPANVRTTRKDNLVSIANTSDKASSDAWDYPGSNKNQAAHNIQRET